MSYSLSFEFHGYCGFHRYGTISRHGWGYTFGFISVYWGKNFSIFP